MIQLINDDCLKAMKEIKSDSIDLVITSPPYANQRKKCYLSIKEEEYVNWFLPIAIEIKRILKDTGSFFLNIKPHTKNGERVLYVFDLILALKRKVGFLFIDEFSWTKIGFPGGLHGRFKNAFEPVYHFTKQKPTKISFNPLACGTPPLKETIERYKRFSSKEMPSPNGSGFRHPSNKILKNLKLCRPTNVIYATNTNSSKRSSFHPAIFPIKLVDFFIKNFTNEGDIVLDCFMGSGTVGYSCLSLNRNFIGIEIKEKYFSIVKEKLKLEEERIKSLI